MKPTSPCHEVLLETDSSGLVWRSTGPESASSTGKSVAQFLSTESLGLLSRTRYGVLSAERNSELIAGLADRLLPRSGQLWVASPQLLFLRAEVDPGSVLETLHHDGVCQRPGWLPVRGRDVVAYRLAAALRRRLAGSDDWEESSWAAMLRKHPSWPALSFAENPESPRVTVYETVELLTCFLDPCWRQGETGGRTRRRLQRYLGLDGRRVCHLVRDGESFSSLSQKNRRLYLVLKHWAGIPPHMEGSQYAPRNWLWAATRESNGTFSSFARSSVRLIELALLLWTASSHTHPEMFAPEHYFDDSADVAAFKHHCLQFADLAKRTV